MYTKAVFTIEFLQQYSTEHPTNTKTPLKMMKQFFVLTFLLISATSFGQKPDWIPFNWEGDSVSGKYFDKLAITIPVTLNNLPNKFKMQFDLGATVTVIYGNSIKPYLEK
jgi:hypothetical protein